MSILSAYAITQPAVAVRDRDVAVGRMADLFAAVPADRHFVTDERRREAGTLYAFDNHTYFEILDPVREGHQRQRFVERNGPGFYMISVDLANDDPDSANAEFEAMGRRVVQRSEPGYNIRAGWHIHPKDACGLLMLLAIKRDRSRNEEWAGPEHVLDIPGNTRFVREVAGVIARTPSPETEQACFGSLGFPMEALDRGGRGWRGPTGNVMELWPESAWEGDAVHDRRDYAVVIRPRDYPALIARLERFGFTFQPDITSTRTITSVDPVFGCRYAIELEDR